MEPVRKPHAYVLRGDQRIEDIRAVEAALLESEGVDPRWPGFDAPDDPADATEAE